MKKTVFLLLSVFLFAVLYGCRETTDSGDLLSEILYDADLARVTDEAENTDIHPDIAELFDNVSSENVMQTNDIHDEVKSAPEPVCADESDVEKENERVSAFAFTEQESVWISTTGKKYHKKPDCSGMKNPAEVLKKQAELDGYTACKRCFK